MRLRICKISLRPRSRLTSFLALRETGTGTGARARPHFSGGPLPVLHAEAKRIYSSTFRVPVQKTKDIDHCRHSHSIRSQWTSGYRNSFSVKALEVPWYQGERHFAMSCYFCAC